MIQEDKSATLATNNDQTLFQPCSWDGTQISPTITANNATGNQRMPDKGNFNCVLEPFTIDGKNAAVNVELSSTLQAHPGGGFSQNCINPVAYSMQAIGEYKESDAGSSCKARDYKDATDLVVEPRYIVRRLTPTECARLQGFPDWWCDNLDTPNPTEEQMQEWREIFETHRRIVGGGKKTDKQIQKFLAHPHSDAAEYKMWGNGIALPNAFFVLSGIAQIGDHDCYETENIKEKDNG